MKVGSFILTLVGIVLSVSLCFAQGEGIANKLEIGAYGILTVPQKGNFDTTGGGGGYLRYYMTENIAIEGAAEYAQWDFSTDVSGATGTLTGDLDVIPIMGTLQYHFTTSNNFSSYIGGGITGMLIDGSAKGTLTPGGASTIDFDNAIGGHICAGIDWKVAENVLFNLDTKYTWAVSDTSESVTDTSYVLTVDDMDMHNFTLRGGLSYKF